MEQNSDNSTDKPHKNAAPPLLPKAKVAQATTQTKTKKNEPEETPETLSRKVRKMQVSDTHIFSFVDEVIEKLVPKLTPSIAKFKTTFVTDELDRQHSPLIELTKPDNPRLVPKPTEAKNEVKNEQLKISMCPFSEWKTKLPMAIAAQAIRLLEKDDLFFSCLIGENAVYFIYKHKTKKTYYLGSYSSRKGYWKINRTMSLYPEIPMLVQLNKIFHFCDGMDTDKTMFDMWDGTGFPKKYKNPDISSNSILFILWKDWNGVPPDYRMVLAASPLTDVKGEQVENMNKRMIENGVVGGFALAYENGEKGLVLARWFVVPKLAYEGTDTSIATTGNPDPMNLMYQTIIDYCTDNALDTIQYVDIPWLSKEEGVRLAWMNSLFPGFGKKDVDQKWPIKNTKINFVRVTAEQAKNATNNMK
jgi:hypothetical protein